MNICFEFDLSQRHFDLEHFDFCWLRRLSFSAFNGHLTNDTLTNICQLCWSFDIVYLFHIINKMYWRKMALFPNEMCQKLHDFHFVCWTNWIFHVFSIEMDSFTHKCVKWTSVMLIMLETNLCTVYFTQSKPYRHIHQNTTHSAGQ